jgi:hypothetical protein
MPSPAPQKMGGGGSSEGNPRVRNEGLPQLCGSPGRAPQAGGTRNKQTLITHLCTLLVFSRQYTVPEDIVQLTARKEGDGGSGQMGKRGEGRSAVTIPFHQRPPLRTSTAARLRRHNRTRVFVPLSSQTCQRDTTTKAKRVRTRLSSPHTRTPKRPDASHRNRT